MAERREHSPKDLNRSRNEKTEAPMGGDVKVADQDMLKKGIDNGRDQTGFANVSHENRTQRTNKAKVK